MFKGFMLGVLATIIVALAGGYIVLRTGLIPANADAQPGSLERWAAATSLYATLDREAPKGPNPVALTDDNLIAGIQLFGATLRDLPRHNERRCIGPAGGKGRIPAAPATGDGRGRRRSRGL